MSPIRLQASEIEQDTAAMAPASAPSAGVAHAIPRQYAAVTAARRLASPAAYAAAISPLEWPTTDDGLMPHDRRRSTSAICRTVQSGWLMVVSFTRDVLASFESSSCTDQPAPRPSITFDERSSDVWNAGKDISSRPMACHCVFCLVFSLV